MAAGFGTSEAFVIRDKLVSWSWTLLPILADGQRMTWYRYLARDGDWPTNSQHLGASSQPSKSQVQLQHPKGVSEHPQHCGF
ncbi:hypothetical protein PAAG_12113 [Paracoccidioides lutzii Pb01]|uniref:Uncharacterized protein n=1 Tax=Paracoccidioides lutzii (strain ATCC MYA-826 / Pb01) TaxID=502779 RepID=A0A0A2VJY6_PARBA|nr:hypothetical protein PAAG_12113 [Paracoccidioides lutzii Pb01]KGQ01169.1 hypothetical protein PAAG_12113 [Paracoccidioides lutzii Pb01]